MEDSTSGSTSSPKHQSSIGVRGSANVRGAPALLAISMSEAQRISQVVDASASACVMATKRVEIDDRTHKIDAPMPARKLPRFGHVPVAPVISLPASVQLIYSRNAEETEELCEQMLSINASKPDARIGFDLEWSVHMMAGVAPRPVATIQLCDASRVLVLQVSAMDSLPPGASG